MGATTLVPARGMRRTEHVAGGVDWLGRRGLGLGGGRRTAGMAIMWLIESSIGVGVGFGLGPVQWILRRAVLVG